MDDSKRRTTAVLRFAPLGDPSAPQAREALARAAALLRAGKLVAFPTETVYGLGADATNPTAVRSIFLAKARPWSDPLIVHVAESAQLAQVATAVPDIAWELARRFWPGPLTLIVPRAPAIAALVAAGGQTIGVRVPAHPVAQALLRAADVPVAAPSANRFMHTSPTTAAHVMADLDGRIDAVLDGGPCAVGVESTVLDLLAHPPRILRPGGISLEALRAVLPEVTAPARAELPATEVSPGQAASGALPIAGDTQAARAPGQMARHYAPRAHLVVFGAQGTRALAALRAEATQALALGLHVGALLPDEEASALAGLPVRVVRLGSRTDLSEISRRLYASLRQLDSEGLDLILAHTFGTAGLGLALEDRLRHAAGGTLRPA